MDKFVCINDVFKGVQKEKIPFLPKKGETYTLLEIYENPVGEDGYVFQELPNPTLPGGLVPNFRKSRFKPVDTITIDSLIEENVENEIKLDMTYINELEFPEPNPELEQLIFKMAVEDAMLYLKNFTKNQMVFPSEDDFVIGGPGSQYIPPPPTEEERERFWGKKLPLAKMDKVKTTIYMSGLEYVLLYKLVYEEDIKLEKLPSQEQILNLLQQYWKQEMEKCRDFNYWYKNYCKAK